MTKAAFEKVSRIPMSILLLLCKILIIMGDFAMKKIIAFFLVLALIMGFYGWHQAVGSFLVLEKSETESAEALKDALEFYGVEVIPDGGTA